jgi:hypothetical protein
LTAASYSLDRRRDEQGSELLICPSKAVGRRGNGMNHFFTEEA